MMEKIKLEEQEDQEEDSTPSQTKSTEPLSPLALELAAANGLSPEQVEEILDWN